MHFCTTTEIAVSEDFVSSWRARADLANLCLRLCGNEGETSGFPDQRLVKTDGF